MAPPAAAATRAAAKGASAAAADALAAPLLPSAAREKSRTTDSLSFEEEITVDDSAEEPRKLGPRVPALGAGLLAAAGLAASAAAMVVMPSAAVLIMGGLCAINAPVVARNSVRLARSDGEFRGSRRTGRWRRRPIAIHYWRGPFCLVVVFEIGRLAINPQSTCICRPGCGGRDSGCQRSPAARPLSEE